MWPVLRLKWEAGLVVWSGCVYVVQVHGNTTHVIDRACTLCQVTLAYIDESIHYIDRKFDMPHFLHIPNPTNHYLLPNAYLYLACHGCPLQVKVHMKGKVNHGLHQTAAS